MTAQTSSSSSPSTYHVFLSFRGKDSAKAFIGHLHQALDRVGYRTFLEEDDDDGIERDEIRSKLEKAIMKSRMSIIVFSKGYASSTRCLDEVVMILQHKRTCSDPHHVLPVFYDVEPTDVKKQTGSFKEAFKRYEERLRAKEGERKYDWTSKLAGWKEALKEAANLAGMDLKHQANG
ncbi:17-beta-estradiol 17-dehydrogenase [Bertholletia excelsa]